jgi:hypothetical protein
LLVLGLRRSLLARGAPSRSRPHRGSRLGAALAAVPLAAATLVAAGSPSAAAPPGYTAGSALLLGDTVLVTPQIRDAAGQPSSVEQYAAERAGFHVTVVTAAQWSAMTAADFARYQLLMVGGLDCGLPAAVTGTAATWAPVVMGRSGLNPLRGNRLLFAGDPGNHYLNGGGNAGPSIPSNPATAGAERVVQAGIGYAGAVPGATGLYLDPGCTGARPDVLAMLDQLSQQGTGFTAAATPACGGSVQLLARAPGLAGLTPGDLAGWGCSAHSTYPTYPTDWQAVALATDARGTSSTCGTDLSAGITACGEAFVLVAGQGLELSAPGLTLSPATGADTVGALHTVTATVTRGPNLVAGQKVDFVVTGANAGVTGTCVPASCETDANGQVTFTYRGTAAGDDTVNAGVLLDDVTRHALAAMRWNPCTTTTPSVDSTVSVDAKHAGTTLVTPRLSTTGPALLVAAVVADGPHRTPQRAVGVSGGRLTWSLVTRSNTPIGTSELWQAHAPSALTKVKVTATLAVAGFDASVTVTAFSGAAARVGAAGNGSGLTGAPAVALAPQGCRSLLWMTAHQEEHAGRLAPLTGQQVRHDFAGKRPHDFYWVQSAQGPALLGEPATIGVTAPASAGWTAAAVEIPAG